MVLHPPVAGRPAFDAIGRDWSETENQVLPARSDFVHTRDHRVIDLSVDHDCSLKSIPPERFAHLLDVVRVVDPQNLIGWLGRVDHGAEQVEDRDDPSTGKLLSHGRDVFEGGMEGRCEQKGKAQFIETFPDEVEFGIERNADRFQKIGASTTGTDRSVAVLDDRDARRGNNEGNEGGDVETACLVTTRSAKVDGMGSDLF